MSKIINLKVEFVKVILRNSTDQIYIKIDGTSPFPKKGYPPAFKIETEPNFGAIWVKENLNIDPEIIDARP